MDLALAAGEGRRLHIGGTCRQEGWEVLNAVPGPAVDHIGNAKDLSAFPTDSLEAIYASHILEHFDYNGEIEEVLCEWKRALKPGGRIFLSVPDLEALACLFLNKEELDEGERFLVIRMIFGGHTDAYDYHKAGLSEEILRRFLQVTGFEGVTRVDNFGIFEDTSSMELKGVPISLNLTAVKPLASCTDHCEKAETPAQSNPPQSSGTRLSDEVSILQGSAWDHGYFSGATYANCYHRELAPNWIDFAALMRGQRSPRSRQDETFNYLDLGSGTGFGLCMLAGAYPEGHFIGVDFHPSHVAQGQWLAKKLGLGNVRFVEADFLSLRHDLRPLIDSREEFSGFEYVVAHGIATWVSEEVQSALLAVAAAALRPGGLFYCSYNTYPGWLGRSCFQMLAGLERQFKQPSSPISALYTASEKLAALARGAGSSLSRQLPLLTNELHGIENCRNRAYLLGEYGSEHWRPLFVADLHARTSKHKLAYVTTATLPEQFLSFLKDPHHRSLLESENHPILRETLFDLAINQSFRRDIFVKGPCQLSRAQRQEAISEMVFIQTALEAEFDCQVTTSLGTLSLDYDTCKIIEDRITDAPSSLAELATLLGLELDDLLPIIALLIHQGRIGLFRKNADPNALTAVINVNQRLCSLMHSGHDYRSIVAPAIGGAVMFSPLESLALEAVESGLDNRSSAALVLMGLEAMGAHLTSASGKRIVDPRQQVDGLCSFLNKFRSHHLPLLRRLGVISWQV